MPQKYDNTSEPSVELLIRRHPQILLQEIFHPAHPEDVLLDHPVQCPLLCHFVRASTLVPSLPSPLLSRELLRLGNHL